MQAVRRTLAGKYQHGGVIHIGIGNAGNQVGGTRPQCAQTAGRVAGKATIYFGHKGRALFMAGKNKFYLV